MVRIHSVIKIKRKFGVAYASAFVDAAGSDDADTDATDAAVVSHVFGIDGDGCF